MSEYAKPLPRITEDNRRFWEACQAHRLELPWCGRCDRAFLPPGPVCPFCLDPAPEWRPASGRGTVSTWVVVHQPWFPAFAADIPYNVVQVELEEGPRVTANVVGVAPEDLRVGLPVEVVFDDVTPEVTLPRFQPR